MVRTANRATLAALFICLALATQASAGYLFTLEAETIDVFINGDGSILLDYRLTFLNQSQDQPIDVVDVGLPKNAYDISGFEAWMDDQQIQDIRPTTNVDVKTGVEVHLDQRAIPYGGRGTLRLRGIVRDMVYRADFKHEGQDYASVEFIPTWFGSQYVQGTTDLTVRFHFPPQVTSDQTVWHREEYASATWEGDHWVFTYHEPRALMTGPSYKYGVGAPASYFTQLVEPPGMIARAAGWFFTELGVICPLACPILFIAGIVVLITWANRRRKMQYLPPKIGVEGVGIKRGLTAPEAAILCEVPLDRVLTMVLFGLLRKGSMRVTQPEPLKLAVHNPDKTGLQAYEKRFIEAIKEDGTFVEAKLREMFIEMIKSVGEKMRGFSRKETAAYYTQIVQRAWQQVMQAGTPQARAEGLDRNAEWMIMDRDYEEKLEGAYGTGTFDYPVWWYHAPAATTAAARPTAHTPAGFAHNIVRGVQNISSSAVANLQAFTAQVTAKTNPVPVSSGGGRSGGGCACACACAGCACACAGGGR